MINSEILALSGPIRGRLMLQTLVNLLLTGTQVAQSLLYSLLLASLASGEPAAAQLGRIGWILGVYASRAALLWLQELAAQETAQGIKERLRLKLFAHLLQLGPGALNQQRTGEVTALLTEGVEGLEVYYSRYLPALFGAGLGVPLVLVFLAQRDAPSAVALGLGALALPTAYSLWMRWRMPRTMGIFTAMAAFGASLLDGIQGILTLKAFDAADRWRARLGESASRLRREAMNDLWLSLMHTGVTSVISLGTVSAVLGWDVWRAMHGQLEPLNLLVILFLGREAFRPLEKLNQAFHSAWGGLSAAPPMAALLAQTPGVSETTKPRALPAPLQGELAFEGVSFSYPGSEKPALLNLSLRIAPGERLGIAGVSGAGKSTLATLLLRFYDPQQGRITLDGVDLRELALDRLRATIAIVAQDTFLFAGTVAENIALGRPQASLDEIRAAAQTAQADEFIQALPQGYETPIGERGTLLSGGQRQRIAIARALLQDAPILILDEATAHLDAAGEAALQTALERLMLGRTTLIIAHRPAALAHVDRIALLEAGQLQSTGLPQEILPRLESRLQAQPSDLEKGPVL